MSWRFLLNAAKAYVSQLPSGKECHLQQPVCSLNIVNDTFEPDMEECCHCYHMVHDLHADKVLEGLHLVFVELPKFKAKNLTEKKMQVLRLRFLAEIGADTRHAPQDLLDDPHVNKALATYQRDWEGAIAVAAQDVRPGAEVKVAVKVALPTDAKACHPVLVEVYDPAGKKSRLYSGVCDAKGGAGHQRNSHG